jgi:hypothetical protein
MSGEGPDHTEVWQSLEGFAEKWARDSNPVDVWYAVKVCVDKGASFPPWVLEYLGECGERVLRARFNTGANHDTRSALQWIFQFEGSPGPGGHFTKSREEFEDEQFAMAFAAAIFDGEKPPAARAEASKKLRPKQDAGAWDDSTLLRRLKKYFRAKHLPGDNGSCRSMLVDWLLRQRIDFLVHYHGVHPSLPDLLQLMAAGAAARGGGGYVLSADGKISRVEAVSKSRA